MPPAEFERDGASGLLCDCLLLAVTGSPAALSVPHYALVIRQTLARELRVMMTRTAARFVPPETMRLFAGVPIHTDLHKGDDETLVPHVDLTADLDLLLVMPATANILGKSAHGICDELVSTAIVACEAPVAFIPSMNERMWRSAVVQRNVATLRDLGHHVIDP
ncbi:MAG TPA: flavoprotein, partial [Solirubrobacteraceae bacterium]